VVPTGGVTGGTGGGGVTGGTDVTGGSGTGVPDTVTRIDLVVLAMPFPQVRV
jgi:hypothetical protein